MVSTVRQALTFGAEALGDVTDARVLLCHATGLDSLQLAVHSNEPIDADAFEMYKSYVTRRQNHEPVAYITGVREFMSLDFHVEPGVLIPRPETEHTVEYVMDICNGKQTKILDICTGSGAIAVSLAHYLPYAAVTAIDISETAVRVARQNAAKHNVADRVNVVCADALQQYTFDGGFDVIASNPPYIPDSVVPGLDADVAEFEPHLALCGGEDGLLFYRAIAKNAPAVLNPGGRLVFEVGHDQAEAVRDILSEDYCDIEFIRDLAGINRVVAAVLR
ncbi:MAG: peptide chain release factor N(5)-glutamine methyltransferase [Clostridia bacterium]|nr:peptide chain release factor N(5)-glutamine methyltransferase [Clostridia bacterium]